MLTKAQEQAALIEQAKRHPITRDYLHINPPEPKRHPLEGLTFRPKPIKPGFPNVIINYPCGIYHGLFLTLQRADQRDQPTANQLNWIYKLRKAGNYADIAYGWKDAWKQIEKYLISPIDSTSNA